MRDRNIVTVTDEIILEKLLNYQFPTFYKRGIANELGYSPDTINKVFTQLEEREIIEKVGDTRVGIDPKTGQARGRAIMYKVCNRDEIIRILRRRQYEFRHF